MTLDTESLLNWLKAESEKTREKIIKARKADNKRVWMYSGDVNLEEGGVYFKPLADDCFPAVEVLPASSFGGPDNLFLINVGTIYVGNVENWQSALDTCGYELIEHMGAPAIRDCTGHIAGMDTEEAQILLADAFRAYSGIESEFEDAISIGPVDFDDYPNLHIDEESITELDESEKLEEYVAKEYL